MKKYSKIQLLFALAFLMLGLNSCLSDLDKGPIDPSVTQQFDQNAIFNKVYASLALTGQEGPAGVPDLDASYIDEGTSAFYRLIWNLNELTTDEAICSWGDEGIPEMNFNSWTSSHGQIKGLYGRLGFIVTISNHFLENTEGKTDDATVKQRAEVRFIRALAYYYMMDMYGNVPFTTKVSSTAPTQIKRADLFTWIEQELKAIEPDMYAVKAAPKYRVDKAANWLLLSRMYLNAAVYTGTARWNDAATYAKKVIDTKNSNGYSLCPEYKKIFMADNDENGAQNEILFPIASDGVTTISYGNSMFVIASTHTEGMLPWGTSEGWGGNRARATLVKKFFPNTADIPTDELGLSNTSVKAKDNRALFYGYQRTLEIESPTVFKDGFSVAKWSNVRADGKASKDPKWVDTDVPFLRVAEAYLTYAEAVKRGAPEAGLTAVDAVNALRTRAGAKVYLASELDLNTILDEWAREFYFEGHRRMDLIRFGYYGGNSSYSWDWKGGVKSGTSFSANYNLFPIPSADINANPNLVQNPGY